MFSPLSHLHSQSLACDHGLPSYIEHSLKQAVFFQPDLKVVFISNYLECKSLDHSIDLIAGIIKIDSTLLMSEKTSRFLNVSDRIFQKDGFGELWISAAARLFLLEDLMVAYNLTSVVHLEADCLMYGSWATAVLPALQAGFKTGLAVTPLNCNKYFLTASVLYIGR